MKIKLLFIGVIMLIYSLSSNTIMAGGHESHGGDYFDYIDFRPPFLMLMDGPSSSFEFRTYIYSVYSDLQNIEVSKKNFAIPAAEFMCAASQLEINMVTTDLCGKTAINWWWLNRIDVNRSLWANAANAIKLEFYLNHEVDKMNVYARALRKALVYHEVLSVMGYERPLGVSSASQYHMSQPYFNFITNEENLLAYNSRAIKVPLILEEDRYVNKDGILILVNLSPETSREIIMSYVFDREKSKEGDLRWTKPNVTTPEIQWAAAKAISEMGIASQPVYGVILIPELRIVPPAEALKIVENTVLAKRASLRGPRKIIAVPSLEYLPTAMSNAFIQSDFTNQQKTHVCFFSLYKYGNVGFERQACMQRNRGNLTSFVELAFRDLEM